MKEEIKEIIDYISSRTVDDILLEDYFTQLEDYITNLEQNDKEWSMIFDTFSKRPYAHKYLEEKKKELNNNKIIGLDSEMIYKDYYDLKLRIDKAIEYIRSEYTITDDDVYLALYSSDGTLDKLENILKGDIK